MPKQNIFRNVAQISNGKRVVVLGPDGERRSLETDEIVEQSNVLTPERFAELDLQVKATLAMAASLVSLLHDAGSRAGEAIARLERATPDDKEIIDRLERIEATLAMPVKPVYDKAGKIIGAKRVKVV